LCYNRDMIIQKIMDDGCEDIITAEEYFEFNIIGGYFGHQNPVFISNIGITDEELKELCE